MMIIDAHAHYGHDYVFDEDNFDGPLLYWYEKCGIDYAIIQPCLARPYIDDTKAIHNEIYELCKRSNGRFFGMASINPHFRPEDYDAELVRCIKELKFVGVKITPLGHAAHPGLSDCRHVYDICSELDIPVMVHTGIGQPHSDPFNLLKPAMQYPQLKFIIAHAGTDLMFEAALYIAQNCPNVYLEPSWLNIYSLKSALDSIGPERIMFSSDMPMNVPVELAKYHALTEDKAVLEQLFHKTAEQVFGLNIHDNNY